MEIPPFEVLTFEVDEQRVCTITMNRPAKRNALSAKLVNELIVALETARDADGIRAVVLTGAGGVFCSGGDLSQMQGGGGAEPAIPFRGGFVELNLAFHSVGKPVIAKVRKYALAGGLGLMCACHFAISEDSATFGTPEIKRGLWPMMIMANIFRTVPRRKGLELVLLGDRISSAEAVGIGLINRAVPADELDDTVQQLAARLAGNPPKTTALGLEAWYAQDHMSVDEALPYLQTQLMAVIGAGEAAEGMAAFFQKRKPDWG